MSSKRPRSLLCSLIYQFLITVYTILGPRTEHAILYQIDFAVQQILKIHLHACDFQKADGMAPVVFYKDIHVTPRSLFASRIGTEEPCLQDGLGFEVVGNPLLHYLGTHRQQYCLSSANIRRFSETSKNIGIFFYDAQNRWHRSTSLRAHKNEVS